MEFRTFTCRTWFGLAAAVCLYAGPAAQAAAPAEEAVTVEQAVAEALERNAGLLAEKANIAIAQARVITAGLRPNPEVSAGGDHLDLAGTGFDEVNGAGPPEFNFRTDFTIERGGKRRLRTEAAEGARSVAELQFLNAARGLVLEVQNAFVDVLLARDSVALARENAKALNGIVEVNEARVKAGDLAEVELIRSRLAALQQESAVRVAEMKLSTALTRLQTAMGRRAPSPTFRVSGELRRGPAVPPIEELRKAAGESRPDVLALRRDVARADAEVRLEEARRKPDPTVGAEYRRQQGVNGKSNSLGFFLSIPLPVFDRNQGEAERARQERRQAALRLQSLEAAVAGEIDTAWRQYETARELLETIESRMLQQARDVREVTEYSYRRGDSTLLELLDAQRAFNETMQGYNEARAELARGLYLLDSVSGKGVWR